MVHHAAGSDNGRRRIAAPAGRHRLSYAAAGRQAAAPDARESRRAVTRAEPIRVLLAASEVVGFAKTGGLADVAGSLPPALARAGCQCVVILPLYRGARIGKVPVEPTDHVFRVPIAGATVPGRLWRSKLPGSDVAVYLVENAEYFDRDDPTTGRGLYQFKQAGELRDYPDNFARYAFFCRAVLEAVRLLDFWPHVLHLNDWQTGLAAVFLREVYHHYTVAGSDRYERIKTLFTIHNMAYQGVFWHWDMATAGLGWRLFNPRQLEFHGHLNCLKAGAVFADLISTVSPTYAKEILTPYFGCGLQGVLSERRDRLFGIVNGMRLCGVGPVARPAPGGPLRRRASHARQAGVQGGAATAVGVGGRAGAPLLGVVARLVEQKGVELILKAAPDLLRQGRSWPCWARATRRITPSCRIWQRAFPDGSAS